MNKESFSRKESLKKNAAIKAVFDKGLYYRQGLVSVYILKKPGQAVNKAVFICKKTLHQKKSVLRNRIRRVLREAYRKTKRMLPSGHDIAIISSKMTQKTLSTAVAKELENVFNKHTKV